MDEPVVVTIDALSRQDGPAALADVVIVASDHRSAGERCADLFSRYPGLTLVVIPRTSEIIIGVRDGTLLHLTLSHASPPSPHSVRCLARLLYLCWTGGCDPASLAQTITAESTGWGQHRRWPLGRRDRQQ